MTNPKVVDELIALGLTTYEAKVFSALTRLGEASVGRIHAVAGVPRSAIYDTLDKLEHRGIVESSTGRPKKFRAMSPKVAISMIESELLGAAKEAREGLESLATIPQKEASEVHIWIIRGRTKVHEKLVAILDSASSELMVAGNPEHILEFSDVWKKARSKRMKVLFGTPEPHKISTLSRYGDIARPSRNLNLVREALPRALFVQADRKTILFARGFDDEGGEEAMVAFWTDDPSLVGFINYLTDSLYQRSKTTRDAHRG